MAIAVGRRMSVEQFEREYMGKRAELWRGEVREYMPAGLRHGIVAMNLSIDLGSYVRQHNLGKTFAAGTGFVIHTPKGDSVLAPDVAFIRKERLPEGGLSRGFARIAPDLVVEVVSPDDSYNDVRTKVGEWLAGGVQVVWVVDPERRVVEVWQPPHELKQVLTENDTLRGNPCCPASSCMFGRFLSKEPLDGGLFLQVEQVQLAYYESPREIGSNSAASRLCKRCVGSER